jgi:prepilin-type N-terminal cleavage/methylation domain-containing protein
MFGFPVPSSVPTNRGFTLAEMIASVGIFTVAMSVLVGSLISVQVASRKARLSRAAIDNLSAAIDSVSRDIRMGSYIHCGNVGESGPLTVRQSCPNGGTLLALEAQGGNPAAPGDQHVYRMTNGRIERATDGGTTYLQLTAPEITVSSFTFYVDGTTVNDDQPIVTIVLRGTTGSGKLQTDLDIQTSVAVRTPNWTL